MGDAAAGGHQVQRAGADGQLRAQAVAVHDLALEQVGRGGEADVRVRPDVDALADHELRRTHLVPEPEYEGADPLPPRRGQRAPHLEAAEVAGAGDDDGLDGVAGELVAERGVVGGLPAHGCFLSAGSGAAGVGTGPVAEQGGAATADGEGPGGWGGRLGAAYPPGDGRHAAAPYYLTSLLFVGSLAGGRGSGVGG